MTEGCNYPSCVLDINKASGVLDLSLKKGLLGELIDKRGKKKPKKKKHPPVLPEVPVHKSRDSSLNPVCGMAFQSQKVAYNAGLVSKHGVSKQMQHVQYLPCL